MIESPSVNSVVIIPVYLPCPNEKERLAFMQGCKVLYRYTICLLSYPELDCSAYVLMAKECGVKLERENFPRSFFESLSGYNRLMLSCEFYKRFTSFDYMLIYQLDAWVFRDELDLWCAKGFDYIGAPWFTENKCHEDGASLWEVGNGGLSLRRIRTFINLFSHNKHVYSVKHYVKEDFKNKRIGLLLKHILFRERFMDLLHGWNDAEDLFYCLRLRGTRLSLQTPSVDEAMFFAFEKSPSYLYGLTNKLPFGCHAWAKYEPSFWERFIMDDNAKE